MIAVHSSKITEFDERAGQQMQSETRQDANLIETEGSNVSLLKDSGSDEADGEATCRKTLNHSSSIQLTKMPRQLLKTSTTLKKLLNESEFGNHQMMKTPFW